MSTNITTGPQSEKIKDIENVDKFIQDAFTFIEE